MTESGKLHQPLFSQNGAHPSPVYVLATPRVFHVSFPFFLFLQASSIPFWKDERLPQQGVTPQQHEQLQLQPQRLSAPLQRYAQLQQLCAPLQRYEISQPQPQRLSAPLQRYAQLQRLCAPLQQYEISQPQPQRLSAPLRRYEQLQRLCAPLQRYEISRPQLQLLSALLQRYGLFQPQRLCATPLQCGKLQLPQQFLQFQPPIRVSVALHI